mmetsp:Transcript_17134/g.47508  ORF Transcript_17134/g.47508 Transcript_17134/m.47508 type:complete len:80 (+) Transcript_17134:1971-2210(+)
MPAGCVLPLGATPHAWAALDISAGAQKACQVNGVLLLQFGRLPGAFTVVSSSPYTLSLKRDEMGLRTINDKCWIGACLL